jgi:hypothetical protein
MNMQPEYGFWFGIFQHAFTNQYTCPAWISFFTGLKNKFDGAFPLVFKVI